MSALLRGERESRKSRDLAKAELVKGTPKQPHDRECPAVGGYIRNVSLQYSVRLTEK
jgi:hypothetical protein